MVTRVAASIGVAALFALLVAKTGKGIAHAAGRAQRADWGRPWLNFLDGLNRIFCRRFHRLNTRFTKLPMHGPAIMVANHISGLDPLLLIAVCRRPLRFIIAKEEYERRGLRWLFNATGCIPVDRGANPRAVLARARKVLADGEIVALFPQGGIQHASEPPRRFRHGVVTLAQSTGAPVYCLRIEGVRGAGRTLGAVFLRSRARITTYAPVHFDPAHPDALLRTIVNRLTRHGAA